MNRLLAATSFLLIVVAARASVSPTGGSLITFNQVGGVITLIPPNSLTVENDFFLPATKGLTNTFLMTDGSGNLMWSNESLGGVTMAGGLSSGGNVSALSFNATGTGALAYSIGGSVVLGLGTSGTSSALVVGVGAAPHLASGNLITAIGWDAGLNLAAPTGGTTLLGANAGLGLTAGSNNTMLGDSTGKLLGTQVHDTFIGSQAGSSFGQNDSTWSTTSNDNVGIGYQAATAQNGLQNVAIGSQVAGASSSLFQDNVMVGYRAGYNDAFALRNVYVGSQAGNGQSLTSSSDNIAIGYQTMFAAQTLTHNVAIGSFAGSNMTSQDSDTLVGVSAQVGNSVNSSIVIGASAIVNASSSAQLGAGTNAIANSIQFFNKNLTLTEWGNLSGTTANVQTQLNALSVTSSSAGIGIATSVSVNITVTSLTTNWLINANTTAAGITVSLPAATGPYCVDAKNTGSPAKTLAINSTGYLVEGVTTDTVPGVLTSKHYCPNTNAWWGY